ncbi:carbon-nitrogen hydrolase family protein [Microbulbifer agarilyticus]|uniref:carbon-nitrogen hydrolase family protein n=1 Tax=Microbulbifer agarilyticus TaxID=260552 RepID=UPI001C95CB17|nr:carbon-nitrogen hydrolase family protein [Microbulbifer agarilyticus]MBY6189596.1 carbon-nitrogen hydrolase family protein [Microbulbifer agarilyticus]
MPKVAALQFATGTDVDENLATCIRMIDRAAADGAKLMVLPEFCNRISWYQDLDQAWDYALDLDGPFLRAIAERARMHKSYVLINVSLRREYRKGEKPVITVTSLFYGPDGDLLGEADKQSLMGHENDFFTPATRAAGLVDTELGRIGFIACRDGISFEPARRLALAGADLLCNSLNSFAFDEASLHVRARAAENRLFMVAANKVGPLVPEQELAQVSAMTSIPESLLYGAGESQVVGVDGRPVVEGKRGVEQVVMAELPDRDARLRLSMGALARRQSSLYEGLKQSALTPSSDAKEEVKIALISPQGTGVEAIERAEELIVDLPENVALAVLPACFPVADPAQDWARTMQLCRLAEERLAEVSRKNGVAICTSVIEEGVHGWHHVGILLDETGRRLVQPQLHRCAMGLAPAGSVLQVFDLPWGRVALLVGEDCFYPELSRMAALKGAHCVLAAPSLRASRGSRKDENVPLLMAARAAENRICLVAAMPGTDGGLVASLEREFTLLEPWRERHFDGNINKPIMTRQHGELTVAALHPRAAVNKMLSSNTHLLRDRAHQSTDHLLQVVADTVE